MRKLYTLALTVFVLQLLIFTAKGQYITIPDPNFSAWLHLNGWDTCMVGNQLDTVCSLASAKRVYTLDLSYQNISDLTGLQYLKWCQSPPCSGSSGRGINLSHNNLTEFPFPLLKHINNLPVDLSYNHIDSFMIGPAHQEVSTLDLSHNGMHKFLKDTAQANYDFGSLNLNYNNIDSFPPLFSNQGSGYFLHIRGNQLRTFPRGHFSAIDCGANQISSFAGWPSRSQAASVWIDSNLFAGNLDLAGIGSYWDVIYEFDCSHNAITSISNIQFSSMSLHGGMGTFKCSDNNLSILPHLPTDTRVIDCHNNPNLQCISNLPNVVSLDIDFSNTDIRCLPRLFPSCVYNSTPAINSVPTCDMYNNIYGCPQYSNMEGFVYADIDSNCVDSADFRLGYIKARFRDNGAIRQQIYSDRNGHYSFDEINHGTYSIEVDTTRLPITVICPDSAYYTAVIDSQRLYQSGFNFAMQCRDGFDIGNVSAGWGIFMPRHLIDVSFSPGDLSARYGLHCAAGVSGQVVVNYSGPVSFAGVRAFSITPSSVSGNTITWNIPDFGTLNSSTGFVLQFLTDSTAQIHTPVCFSVSVTPVIGDLNPSNNTYSICDEIAAAYDPNDKRVYPAGEIDTTQEWLTYTIRFQNTGTAPATHVLIIDTLDSDLDVSSFELLGYSHENITQISETGIVRFNFPNINLPDSNANEPASHGYVQYRIKINDNMPIGTVINNTASIYFDFNPPIVTNTTTNTITNATNTSVPPGHQLQTAIRIYPNPATNEILIDIGGGKAEQISVYDLAGKQLITINQPFSTRIDISALSAGAYIAEVKTGDVVRRARWVKM